MALFLIQIQDYLLVSDLDAVVLQSVSVVFSII